MRIREITEAFDQDDIARVLSADTNEKKVAAALRLLHLQTTVDKKRADMRDEIARVAVISDTRRLEQELTKILYKWMLSLGGLPTGIKTSKGRKGIGYSK